MQATKESASFHLRSSLSGKAAVSHCVLRGAFQQVSYNLQKLTGGQTLSPNDIHYHPKHLRAWGTLKEKKTTFVGKDKEGHKYRLETVYGETKYVVLMTQFVY